MIYFDNSASTYFKPQIVKDRVNQSVQLYTANPGRSAHKASMFAARAVQNVRQLVANFFGASLSRVVFTHNCTTALNMAIFGSVVKGDHVLTTSMEHNSVLRPLRRLELEGMIDLDIVPMNSEGYILLQDIIPFIKENTRVVVMTMCSNVTGAVNDIRSIGEYCHRHNMRFIVDCAQSAGHIPISVQRDNIDILCFAGHKGLYALPSIGGMVLSNKVSLRPVILGGTGVGSESLEQEQLFPDNFESGTISTPLVVSLGAGVEYVIKNYDFINTRIKNLTSYAFVRLKTIKNIKIYSNARNCLGVISFNLDNVDPHELADYLNKNYDIAVRSGLHCAPLIHKQLGTFDKGGAVRISLNHKNSPDEIDTLVDALNNYLSNNH